MAICYLGLGSNLGDRKQYLHRAVQTLSKQAKLTILKLSSLYETEPWGYTKQDVFLNLVVEIETELLAEDILKICQKIEHDLDRVRELKWGPRTVDLDILLYDHEVIETENLKIPHPYLLERDFVVIPLSEIAPDLVVKGKSMKQWAQKFNHANLKMI